MTRPGQRPACPLLLLGAAVVALALAPAPSAGAEEAAAPGAASAAAPNAPAGPAREPAAGDPAAAARATVERLHAALLDVGRRGPELTYEERYARLEPVVTAAFDLPAMARLALGATWRQLDAQARERFVEVFSRLAVANYAARFRSLGSEHFETVEVETAPRGMMIVRTRLVRPDDEPVRLDYRMRRTRDGWRIVDVVLDGAVSELALRRAEYAAIVEREGFDGLVRALEKQLAERAREGASA